MNSIKNKWLDSLAEYILLCFEYDSRLIRPMTPEAVMDSILEICDDTSYRGSDLHMLAMNCSWCNLDGLNDWLYELIGVTDNKFVAHDDYEQDLLDIYIEVQDCLATGGEYPYYVIQVSPEIVVVTPEEIQDVIDSVFS